MKLKEISLNAIEYSTEGFDWVWRKLRLKQEEDLSKTYAGRQMGMWVHGFTRQNMCWLNRLFKKLGQVDDSVRESEPGIQTLLDTCLERGLCSQNLYDALRQYGDRDNGLPLVIRLEVAS
jgi:hypothetical protein